MDSQSPASQTAHLQELKPVVDEEVVSDERLALDSNGLSEDIFMKHLDKLVLALVIIGILVFAGFQISQAVSSHQNPATQATVIPVERTFPAVMICPFSYANSYDFATGFCPKWSPTASLKLTFSSRRVRAFNTNLDVDSKRQSPSTCPRNIEQNRKLDPDDVKFNLDKISKEPLLNFNFDDSMLNAERKLIKNAEAPKENCPGSCGVMGGLESCANLCTQKGVPLLCNGWTPPNVECLIMDPLIFEENAKKASGFDPTCNPMKENRPNSLDSFQVAFTQLFTDMTMTYKGLNGFSGFTKYSTDSIPDNLETYTIDYIELNSYSREQMGVPPGQFQAYKNPKVSIFGGLVAIFYDSSKGIPSEVDFDGARVNSMNTRPGVFGSTVLLTTSCDPYIMGASSFCKQVVSPAKDVSISYQINEILTNPVSGAYKTINSTFISIQNSEQSQENLGGRLKFAFSMKFSSASSTHTKQIVSITVLTTLSIIISTAATLWGSQEKIKEFTTLVYQKVKAFLKTRRDSA